ncbi:AraC family transcriptional regulator [Celeribacter litoreus]|uniref:AraC family transcriptional regulator n=1 Tax=Celeribacter litoreus TaxID=2876714 RepID=UPI001CCAE553|nr:helix-turn-helix domain-containing protein [Celeribacter litoreus]MCA0043715.1 AraC family transcriptional regulator [Celeribacter litoreus]
MKADADKWAYPYESPTPTGSAGLAERPYCRSFTHGWADVPYHWHRAMEVLYVLRGGLRLMVEGQVCEMEPGDLIIINSDVPHNSMSQTRDTLVCGVHLDPHHFERAGLPGFSTRQYLCRSFLHGRSFSEKIAPMKSLIARLIVGIPGQPEEAMSRAICADMLALFIYSNIPYEESRDAVEDAGRRAGRARILRVLDELDPASGMDSLGDIAERENVSLSYLSRQFKQHLGMGYKTYSLNLMLDQAAEDLSRSDATVSEIAERLQFGNPTAFYRKFKERFGCSPAEYRKQRTEYRSDHMMTEADMRDIRRILSDRFPQLKEGVERILFPTSFSGRRALMSGPHEASALRDAFR